MILKPCIVNVPLKSHVVPFWLPTVPLLKSSIDFRFKEFLGDFEGAMKMMRMPSEKTFKKHHILIIWKRCSMSSMRLRGSDEEEFGGATKKECVTNFIGNNGRAIITLTWRHISIQHEQQMRLYSWDERGEGGGEPYKNLREKRGDPTPFLKDCHYFCCDDEGGFFFLGANESATARTWNER